MRKLQLFLDGVDDDEHALAFQLGHLFEFAVLFDGLREFEEDEFALVLIDDGSSLEEDADLHLAALFQEADGVVGLELEVVVVGLGAHADLLDDDFDRLGLLFLLLTLLLVKELLVVHHLADGRSGLRGDLHQIEVHTFGYSEGLAQRNDVRLQVVAHDANGRGCDEFVDFMRGLFLGRRASAHDRSVELRSDGNLRL